MTLKKSMAAAVLAAAIGTPAAAQSEIEQPFMGNAYTAALTNAELAEEARNAIGVTVRLVMEQVITVQSAEHIRDAVAGDLARVLKSRGDQNAEATAREALNISAVSADAKPDAAP
jgi:dihydroxyacetone kinase